MIPGHCWPGTDRGIAKVYGDVGARQKRLWALGARKGQRDRFCGSLRLAVAGPDFVAVFRAFVGRCWGWARWRFVIAGLIALFGVTEFALHLYFSRAAPRLSEWEALRPAVERLVDAGTLVVVAPSWAEPNARFALGDQLMPLSQVARADESRFERALEISTLGQSASELGEWQLESEQREGRFVLRSWSNPRVMPVLYDFLEHTDPEHARVSVHRQGKSDDCPWTKAKVSNGDLHGHPTFPARRFVCPYGDWSFVGTTVIEDQLYRPRRCIWAHPVSRGVLAVCFESVPIGATIRGYGALPYFFEREARGTAIELAVYVAGEPVGDWQHADGQGWKAFEFSTARFAGQHHPVEFRVQSKRAWRREFCFQADVR